MLHGTQHRSRLGITRFLCTASVHENVLQFMQFNYQMYQLAFTIFYVTLKFCIAWVGVIESGHLTDNIKTYLHKGSRKKSSFLSGPATKAYKPPPSAYSGHMNFSPYFRKKTFFAASL